MNTTVLLAGCLISDGTGYLLIHRNYKGVQQWELPGGKVEPDESSNIAAMRELKEELNLDVEVKEMIFQNQFDENGIHYIYNIFDAVIIGGNIELKEQNKFDNYSFFTLFEINNKNSELSPNMKNLVHLLNSKA